MASKNQLTFPISAILMAIIVVCILPYHMYAVIDTLHNQTLDSITKNINVFIANSQINVGDDPEKIAIGPKNTLYVANLRSDTLSIISTSKNTKTTDIQVGIAPRSIAVDFSSNTIYVANAGSNSVSAINGTNHRVENIPVGSSPTDLAVDGKSDTIYVANSQSKGISVIDGISNKVVTGVTFKIDPANSGFITCNKMTPPINQYLYLWSGTTCTAIPNKGFEFSSWVQNLKNNSSRTIRTSNNDSSLNSFLDFFGIKKNDAGATLNVTQFGSFTGHFKALPPLIPPQYLVTLLGIMIGTLAPPIYRWLNSSRQRKNLRKLIDRIDSEHSKIDRIVLDNEIMRLYTKGKIADSHYALLKDKISEYYPDPTKQ